MTCSPKVSKGVGCQEKVGLASGFASDVYTFTASLEVCLLACPPYVSKVGGVSGGGGAGSMIGI